MKPLPPGWQKKLAAGSVISVDWWDRFTPVSYDHFPGVPRCPDAGLYLYDDHLYHVHKPKREIIDVVVVPTIVVDL